MCREVRGCMLEEFAWRVYNAMLGRAVRGMRGVKPMDKRWIQCAEESRRALLKRYPAAGEDVYKRQKDGCLSLPAITTIGTKKGLTRR